MLGFPLSTCKEKIYPWFWVYQWVPDSGINAEYSRYKDIIKQFQYNIDGSNVNEETVGHLRQRLNVMREIVKVNKADSSPLFTLSIITRMRTRMARRRGNGGRGSVLTQSSMEGKKIHMWEIENIFECFLAWWEQFWQSAWPWWLVRASLPTRTCTLLWWRNGTQTAIKIEDYKRENGAKIRGLISLFYPTMLL